MGHYQPQRWTHWDLNPGPSACEADVIPLHHVPRDIDGRGLPSCDLEGSSACLPRAPGSCVCRACFCKRGTTAPWGCIGPCFVRHGTQVQEATPCPPRPSLSEVRSRGSCVSVCVYVYAPFAAALGVSLEVVFWGSVESRFEASGRLCCGGRAKRRKKLQWSTFILMMAWPIV